jgi:hypothetical protein
LAGAYNDAAFAEQLNSSETALAIDLFNHKRPLDADLINFVKPKSKSIIAGALRGLKSLFVYFNDFSIQIPAGVKKMIDNSSVRFSHSNPECGLDEIVGGFGGA